MRSELIAFLALIFSSCATMQMGRPSVTILVDLDPASFGDTVIVESITADRQGRLYLPDRVSGNIFQVDTKSPKTTVVGRIEPREIKGKKVNADGAGIAFNQQGDLLIASVSFGEVVRLRGSDLNPAKPGRAETFATGMPGANAIAFDKRGNLYVSGGRGGKIYRVGTSGGPAKAIAQIDPHTRTLRDGKTTQPIVENGLAFDTMGVLHVADTSRGAIWKIAIDEGGNPGKPTLLVQSSLLEGADGLDFDTSGRLWVTANERNAILFVTPDGKVQEIAKNGSQGPLEFPSAIVFVGGTAYISNNDTPRRDNMDANGKTALDGIGASIAQITP